MTESTVLREYEATYQDGKQYKLMARGVREAVMAATELNNTRVIRVLPTGEW